MQWMMVTLCTYCNHVSSDSSYKQAAKHVRIFITVSANNNCC